MLSELAVCPLTDNAALSKIEIELFNSLIASSSSGVGRTCMVAALEARLKPSIWTNESSGPDNQDTDQGVQVFWILWHCWH